MNVRGFGLAATILLLAVGVANAEVKAAAPDGLVFQFKGQMPVGRNAAWKRVVAIGSWWSDAHTYSGKAANMTLDAAAGGCWCEIWAGGQVEHGRVVAVLNNQLLRLASALGPLQDTGANAAMTITLADGPSSGTTSITMDYKVIGSSLTNLVPMAAPVDGVLQEQFDRLLKPSP